MLWRLERIYQDLARTVCRSSCAGRSHCYPAHNSPALEEVLEVKRRRFIAALGAAAMVSPAISRAQQTRLRTIGVLMGLEAGDQLGQAEFNSLQHGLRELGWNHGQNEQLEVRWPDTDIDRIGTAAKELVTLHPEIIVARGTPSTRLPNGKREQSQLFSCKLPIRSAWGSFKVSHDRAGISLASPISKRR